MIAPVGTPLLQLHKIDTFYGAMQVHFGIDLQVDQGEIVCLLGGNASGKSTTMKIILGLVKPRSGQVRFAGQAITGLATPQIIRLGVGSVPEARRIFAQMTVRENLLMGAYKRHDKAEIALDYARTLDLFPRLKERLHQPGGVLSGGGTANVGDWPSAHGAAPLDLYGRADHGPLTPFCRSGAGADRGDQSPGRYHLYGRAKC